MNLIYFNHVEIFQIHTSYQACVNLENFLHTGFAGKKYGCIQRSCVNLHHVYFF